MQPSLSKNSAEYKKLQNVLKLNDKEFTNFLDHFGLNFYYIIHWVNLSNKNLTEFINYQKIQRKLFIQKTFLTQKKLFDKIMNEANIDNWNIDEDAKDFLKLNNLIVEDDMSKLNYYDNLSKIILDEMRKEKEK